MKFVPQLVRPTLGDSYYNTKKAGGYNPCIPGNPQRRVEGLNVLPNCTGYATGRWNQLYHEILGGSGCEYLGNTNAANYIALAKKQGLKISQEPTLGGCMVWKGGKTSEGHVAIVEMIVGDKVTTSESEYYGKPFVIYTRYGADWRGGCYWMGRSYQYLGCIENPAVHQEEDMTKEEVQQIVEETIVKMFPNLMRDYNRALAQLPADPGAQPFIDKVKAAGIMGGDPDGNFRPKSNVTRQEVAIVAANLLPDE